jgi:nitrite reductase/ring-hydroxylating ferredoxin subunit
VYNFATSSVWTTCCGGMISRMLNRPGRCPRHYACFDVRTGRLLNGPVSVDVPIYEVRIEGDTVFVKGGTD